MRGQGIAFYARNMLNGSRLLVGGTGKLGDTGQLLDGQHRLNAVVEAGVTVKRIVVRDIPAKVIPAAR